MQAEHMLSPLIFAGEVGRNAGALERSAMVRADTMCIDGSAVCTGSIAFIGDPVIMWKLVMQPHHIFIAISLCQATCRCYRCINAIALYDAGMRYSEIRSETVSIN